MSVWFKRFGSGTIASLFVAIQIIGFGVTAQKVFAAGEPIVVIISHPPGFSSQNTATFEFSTTQESDLFCSIDASLFSSCVSPYTSAPLSEGPHVLSVYARNMSAQVGPTDTYDWTIDTSAPDTTITPLAPGTTTNTTSNFVLTSNETATFECKLDGGSYSACNSSYTTPALTPGNHTLYARAVDAATNADQTPAQYDWNITTELSGSGTTHDPILIHDCYELLAMDDTESGRTKSFALANDIDCSAVTNFTPIGKDSLGYNNSFDGTFDGNNFTINGINITSNSGSVGLFGQTHDATIRNTHLTNGSITSTSSSETGSFAGFAWNTSFANVTSDLTISSDGGWAVGGIAGYIESEPESVPSASLTDSWFTGEVTGGSNVGGIVGSLQIYEGYSYTISKTFSNAIVSGTSDVGGIAGATSIGYANPDTHPDSTALFKDTYSLSSITASDAGAGGITGGACNATSTTSNQTIIEIDSSYFAGDIMAGNSEAGGIIGRITCNNDNTNSKYKVTNSFVAGLVQVDSAEPPYGIVGGDGWHEGSDDFDFTNNAVDDSITNVDGLGSYIDGDPTKIVYSAGPDENYFFGNKTNAPFNTWDFEHVWGIHLDGYPTFLAGPGAVTLNSAEDNNLIKLAQSGCSSIDAVSSSKESSLSLQDPAYAYPNGLLGFTLTGCDANATIEATFTGTYDIGKIVIRKYNPDIKSYTTLTAANSKLTTSLVTLDSKPALLVSYTIADNGPLDQDPNLGTITDPSGPATLVVSSPNTGIK